MSMLGFIICNHYDYLEGHPPQKKLYVGDPDNPGKSVSLSVPLEPFIQLTLIW